MGLYYSLEVSVQSSCCRVKARTRCSVVYDAVFVALYYVAGCSKATSQMPRRP